MATDTEVILMALSKERAELHDKLMQVDRIIKRVKGLDYSSEQAEPVKQLEPEKSEKVIPAKFYNAADIKVQVLRAFDILR